MSNFMPIAECNEWTYQYNQNNLKDPDRQELFNVIKSVTNMSDNDIRKNITSICYCISFVFDLWFKNFEKDDIDIDDIFYYLFNHNHFIADNGFYQDDSSKFILTQMHKDDMIHDYKFRDIDFRKTNRQDVFNRLTDRMQEKDFHCCRVSFCTDNKYVDTKEEGYHDHTLIVANLNNTHVVMDTSWRPHDFPDNKMSNFITAKNIRWFTEVY